MMYLLPQVLTTGERAVTVLGDDGRQRTVTMQVESLQQTALMMVRFKEEGGPGGPGAALSLAAPAQVQESLFSDAGVTGHRFKRGVKVQMSGELHARLRAYASRCKVSRLAEAVGCDASALGRLVRSEEPRRCMRVLCEALAYELSKLGY